jgi:hypothetical protein
MIFKTLALFLSGLLIGALGVPAVRAAQQSQPAPPTRSSEFL